MLFGLVASLFALFWIQILLAISACNFCLQFLLAIFACNFCLQFLLAISACNFYLQFLLAIITSFLRFWKKFRIFFGNIFLVFYYFFKFFLFRKFKPHEVSSAGVCKTSFYLFSIIQAFLYTVPSLGKRKPRLICAEGSFTLQCGIVARLLLFGTFLAGWLGLHWAGYDWGQSSK